MNWSKFSLVGIFSGSSTTYNREFDVKKLEKELKKKLKKYIKNANKKDTKENKQKILESITPDDIQILKRILIMKIKFLITIKENIVKLKINYACIRDINFIIDYLNQIKDSALTRSTPMYGTKVDDHNVEKKDIKNKEIAMITDTKYIYSFFNLLETINENNINENNIDLNFIKELYIKVERFVEHFYK